MKSNTRDKTKSSLWFPLYVFIFTLSKKDLFFFVDLYYVSPNKAFLLMKACNF